MYFGMSSKLARQIDGALLLKNSACCRDSVRLSSVGILSVIGTLELVSSCAGLVVISLSRWVGLIADTWRGGAAKHRIWVRWSLLARLAARALIDCDLSLTTA